MPLSKSILKSKARKPVPVGKGKEQPGAPRWAVSGVAGGGHRWLQETRVPRQDALILERVGVLKEAVREARRGMTRWGLTTKIHTRELDRLSFSPYSWSPRQLTIRPPL